ncbi:MHC class I polypeptide-related sequence B-like [Chanos chanos]|uniref:MHC class I polypeptide-related sequence B-like n=1 Tax=Chanos chanos TaxID=29144 RepID=A0A6J2WIB5_CHACN|nr:MHC class I polypeptide-related sequence B-like [Chanos chanos]
MAIFTRFICLFCPIFALCILQVQSEIHSLYYIYTALSKPVSVPGIHEFTAMGLLDDREIDYYNSQDKVKIPRQEWMRESLTADYWEKGTQSRKSKEQWFKVNVNILMDRMNHNQSDLHVLQWRHGCEAERHSDGSVRFVRGVDQYGYDGNDFLSFDLDTMQWVAPVPQAVPTKRKWDDVPILNMYTKGYLEKECVYWLSKFLTYGKEDLNKNFPPDVSVFTTRSLTPGRLFLTCMATGFYPKDITMNIREKQIQLPLQELSSGVRPNNDGTYQLRKTVEIPDSNKEDYECYVDHMTLKKTMKETGVSVTERPPSTGNTVRILQVQSEIHSLYYIYTALSKPVSAPGIHEFTAMGLLDDREIDYYNSQDKVKIPRQDWMKESLTDVYWEKGTQSRKSKEQWFKVNVNILMDRMNHNQSDLHVLQWRHGCEAEKHSDGSVRFVSGVDQYGYDGNDFLSFDLDTMQWVAPVPQAVPTKRKWDDVPILNMYTKGYLEKECVYWLSKFLTYGKEDLNKNLPPDVSVFTTRSLTPGRLFLTCMATGFYPKDITMNIREKQIQLPLQELSSGVRPNNDGTYQLRKTVEIPDSNKEDYECYVDHMTLKKTMRIDKETLTDSSDGAQTGLSADNHGREM